MAYAKDIYGSIRVPAPPKPKAVTNTQSPRPAAPAAPQPSPAPKPVSTASTNSNYNQSTAALQKKLKEAGFDPGPIDGIKGPKTKAAEAAYNKSMSQPTPAPKPAAPSYNPQTGIVTNSNGSQEVKYTWEPDGSGNLAATNAGTGEVLPGSPINPKVNTQQIAKPNSDTSAIQNQLAALISAISQQNQQKQQSTVPAFDVAALKSAIQNRFGSVKSGLLAKIEAARNKALGAYGGLSDQAVQSAQGNLESNYADLAQSLRKVFEGSEAAGGYRGGMSVQGQIDANTVAQNNANAIRQNKTNTLNDIARNIEQINKEAEQDKIASEADTEAQLSQALMDADKYGADYDLQRAGVDLQNRQFDFSKGIQEGQLTGTYGGQDTLAKQQFDAEQAWNEWNKEWEIENEAWQRSADNPQVQAQVLQNKAQMLANQLATLELQNYPEEQKLKIQQYRKEIEQIGAVPAMSQYDIDIKKAQLDQIKAETDNLRNPEPTQTETSNYYTSSALNELNKLPDIASKKAWLNQHAAEIIQNAGTSAYSFLLDSIDPDGIYQYNN
ncbi:MAG: peptidoglycan-binding domain-containing protein [Clostridiaceae bacterium]